MDLREAGLVLQALEFLRGVGPVHPTHRHRERLSEAARIIERELEAHQPGVVGPSPEQQLRAFVDAHR